MLKLLRGVASGRKLRLFAAACARRCWEVMTYYPEDAARCVETAEDFADALCSLDDLEAARAPDTILFEYHIRNFPVAWDASLYASAVAGTAADPNAEKAADGACWVAQFALAPDTEMAPDGYAREGAEHHAQAALLRCLVGNPFRQAASCPSPCSPLVSSLAQAAYDHRHLPSGSLDNARLSVLADALEEAGCTDQEILDHLRTAGPHLRGCWPLDRLLKRE
jgi:hypothetical protein